MATLESKVAIVTGAGRGIGRAHALLFAQQGARVVVNDLGAAAEGGGSDLTPAQEVVAETRGGGGEAVASGDDVSTAEGADALLRTALDAFGELDVLVNNAGIIRDRVLVNMSDEEFDSVIRVHLRGHFCPTRAAARYWREQAKAGAERRRAVVNTTSNSGLYGTAGQTNYAAAKAGIATMTRTWAQELDRYGVRVNAYAPFARTRLSEGSPTAGGWESPGDFDFWDPGNMSPLVAYLASDLCEFSGHVFFAQGGQVCLMQGYGVGANVEKDGRWTVAELAEALHAHAAEPALGEWETIWSRRPAAQPPVREADQGRFLGEPGGSPS